jgi:16S rRNA (guanine527-N7)-methyltransferase
MSEGGGGGPRDVRAARLRTPGVRPEDLTDDRSHALELTPVSRETAGRLERFVTLLLDWQQRVNLIAPSTEPTLWTRHIADSLQLIALAPDARVWADFGSGAGFPGLVIACALAETPGARVYLVESNTKKAAFLREAVRAVDAPAIVRGERAEDFVNAVPEAVDVVTARALASLRDLLAKAYPLLVKGAVGLFPKGQAVEAELTEAAKCWRIQATLAPSRTDPKAQIVIVRGLEPKLAAPAKRGGTAKR